MVNMKFKTPEVIHLPIQNDHASQNASALPPFLEAANNVRKNLLRLYRRQKWKLNHLALFPVVIVYYELLLRLFCGIGMFRNLIYPLLFGLAFGLICTCITIPFSRKVNRIVSMVLLYATALLFTVECLIQNSYQVFMTLSAIRTGAGGVVGGFLGDLLRSIFLGLPKILMFFLPAILYTVTGRRRMPARRYPIAFAGIILVLALLIQGVAVLAANHGSSAGKYKGQFNFNSATQVFGLLTSTRLEAKYSSKGTGKADFVEMNEPTPSPSAEPVSPTPTPEKIYGDNVLDIDFDALNASTEDETLLSMNRYVASQTPSKQNEYTGLFRGKNLILICAEAYCDCVAVNPELTPTLNRLIHNGIYFSEFYQPTWGGSTSSGEYSLLFGLAPMDGVETMLETQYNNNYWTLGSQLSRLGYHGNAYHDGDYDFYDRYLTHVNLGYDEFLAYGNGLEDITGLWTGDDVMFDTTMDTYIDNQPFSVYYMTISGHCTYRDDNEKVEKYLSRVQNALGSRYKKTTLNYFCYQMELETALTTMIEKLEEKGIADDTVIVMTGDHYPYGLEQSHTFGNTEDYVTDLYGYEYTNSWEQDHNNLILWSGCLEHEYKDKAVEISDPCYSLDIVPTLSNLFGLEYDSRLLVGRDVFSDTEALAMWNNYSWATVRGKYDSAREVFYPNEGYDNDQSYVDRINQIVANKLSYSGKVVDYDYFGYLFGNSSD